MNGDDVKAACHGLIGWQVLGAWSPCSAPPLKGAAAPTPVEMIWCLLAAAWQYLVPSPLPCQERACLHIYILTYIMISCFNYIRANDSFPYGLYQRFGFVIYLGTV